MIDLTAKEKDIVRKCLKETTTSTIDQLTEITHLDGHEVLATIHDINKKISNDKTLKPFEFIFVNDSKETFQSFECHIHRLDLEVDPYYEEYLSVIEGITGYGKNAVDALIDWKDKFYDFTRAEVEITKMAWEAYHEGN